MEAENQSIDQQQAQYDPDISCHAFLKRTRAGKRIPSAATLFQIIRRWV
jgi:hypothetical protein